MKQILLLTLLSLASTPVFADQSVYDCRVIVQQGTEIESVDMDVPLRTVDVTDGTAPDGTFFKLSKFSYYASVAIDHEVWRTADGQASAYLAAIYLSTEPRTSENGTVLIGGLATNSPHQDEFSIVGHSRHAGVTLNAVAACVLKK